MNIVYLAVWSGGPASGVGKKILSQISHWGRQGHRVDLVILSKNRSWPRQTIDGQRIHLLACDTPWATAASLTAVTTRCAELKPDLIYQRQTLWFPGLESICRYAPSIVEIQTDDLAELPLTHKKGLLHRVTRHVQLGSTVAHVYVTNELQHLPHYARCGKPGLVIANALPDLAACPYQSQNQTDRPRFIFIGTAGMRWHGVDKVVALARLRPQWDFDIVGLGAADIDAVLPDNVTAHGFLPHQDYLAIVQRADIAIATLALHRNDMHEACPLKLREYLALGLPTITAFTDPDLTHAHDFVLQLPNNEDGVCANVERIDNFLATWRGRRFDTSRVVHINATTKEQQRLAFFERFALKP